MQRVHLMAAVPAQDDERYMRHYPWACFFAMLYPLGIPGGLFYLLRTRRDQKDEFGHGWTERLRLVTKSYSKRFWWFEVYELLRKCLLCGILIFIMPETATQVAMGLLIAVASSSLHLHFRSVAGSYLTVVCGGATVESRARVLRRNYGPWCGGLDRRKNPPRCRDDLLSRVCRACFRPFLKPDDNSDQAIVLLVIAFSLFSGLLLKTDTTADDEYELSLFAAILTAVNIIAMMVPPVHLAVAMFQKKRSKKKPLQIAPDESEAERPNREETQQREGSEQQEEGASARSRYAASGCEGEGEGKDGASEEAVLPPQQRHMQQNAATAPPFVQIVQLAPPMVPTVQLAPTVVTPVTQNSLEMYPSAMLLHQHQHHHQPPQQQQMLAPPQSVPAAASRYAQGASALGQPQWLLPAVPWMCSLCTFDHTLECCAAKATCCMCGAGRTV